MNLLFNSFEGSNEEKRVGKKGKTFYSEMQGNVVRRGWVCENLIKLSMYDGPIETIEYIWVNISYILDWIIGFCHTVDNSGILLINQ